MVFQRKWLIKKIVDSILEKEKGSKFNSYYWRAPVGSGKTVFLKLLGKELQGRNCDVYFILAKTLDRLPIGYISKLAQSAGGKTVVLLIDEVQNNMEAELWNELLKGSKPGNLLVLGVGVPHLSVSPQFDMQFPANIDDPFPMFLTHADLPEIIAEFKNRKSHNDEVITGVCNKILDFTCGQLFPFVTFVEHFLNENEIDLIKFDAYLSSQEFMTSAASIKVRLRCFDYLNDGINSARRLLTATGQPRDSVDLEKLGLWKDNSFISPLVISEICFKAPVKKSDVMLELDHSQNRKPYAEQIICAGLRDMEDFKDAFFDKTAVGFRWGFIVRKVLEGVWVAPQIRSQSDERKKPLLDFFLYFNGRLNLGIEVALNLRAEGIREHLERFDADYKLLKDNRFVLLFDTENDGPIINMEKPYDTLEAKNRIYTYIKKKNALYCGKTMVRKDVSRYIPSPPKRSFSAIAVGRLSNALKFI